MRIAVDLDGVVYEWQRTARYMLNTYRNAKLPPVSEFWFTWDAPKDRLPREDWRWLWDEGVKLGLFRYGHMTTGARVGMQELVRQGHKLSIATSRPSHAVNDTVDWVSLYFKDIPLEGIHILSQSQPKSVVDADILIDDRPENIIEWERAGRHGIVYDRPWNQDCVALWRATSWKAVTYIVEAIADGREGTEGYSDYHGGARLLSPGDR